MDNVLTNDLALAFQLVSDKEKKKNKKLLKITKEIVSNVLEVKRLRKKRKRKQKWEIAISLQLWR
jgi:hypothetical protein